MLLLIGMVAAIAIGACLGEVVFRRAMKRPARHKRVCPAQSFTTQKRVILERHLPPGVSPTAENMLRYYGINL